MFRQAALTLTVVALSSSAFAGATLKIVTPQVSVNQGEGYKQVATTTQVDNGDQVMAAPGGRGKIIYSDGCVTDIYPGSVVTVGKCYTPMTAGLETPVEAAPAVVPWVPIVGAAAVLGVGICAVSGCFDDDDPGRRPPRSP